MISIRRSAFSLNLSSLKSVAIFHLMTKFRGVGDGLHTHDTGDFMNRSGKSNPNN